MARITIRIDEVADTALWVAIQTIPTGQRNAQLKRILADGFRLGDAEVLQRLDALEQRMAAWEAGTPASAPSSLASATCPATPPSWKESLAQLGAFDD